MCCGNKVEHPPRELQARAKEGDEGRHGVPRPGEPEAAWPPAEQCQRETGDDEHQSGRDDGAVGCQPADPGERAGEPSLQAALGYLGPGVPIAWTT